MQDQCHQPKPVINTSIKTPKAFSFYTYSRIYPGRMNFPLWFMLCVPGSVFVSFYLFEDETGIWSLYTGFALYAIFIVRWILDLSVKIYTYPVYKNFTANLGFTLEGWETIGTLTKLLHGRYWSRHSLIEVFFKDTAQAKEIKLVKDALSLFMNEANKTFYEAQMGHDGRRKWEQVNKNKLMGSSNNEVIGCMYTLMNKYLRSIQNKYHIITSVKITFDDEIYEVSPPSGD